MEAKPDNLCPVCGKDKGRNKIACSWACNSALRSNKKECVICGKEYLCPPTNYVKTCSKQCSSALRTKINKEKAVYNEALVTARANLAESPIFQPDENHVNARTWVIKSPSGEVYECRNLMNFIRENAELFNNEIRQAWDGITKIKYSMQGKRKFKSSQWKGWTLIEWGD